MKKLLIAAAVLLVLYVSYRIYRITTLSRDLDKLVARGAVILDVRTQAEFERGHIEGAVNLPLGQLRERYVELDSTKTYITVCSHGLRSVKAQTLLKDRGFRRVYNGGATSDLEKIISRN
ncbi:rhodanese-like domain-containing protein [Nostoc ellipsosporum NOK]|nr:rhodanese-like domain-containing protein [Nostoc ellipsosporum NOK]